MQTTQLAPAGLRGLLDQRPALSLTELERRASDPDAPIETVLLTLVDPHGRPKGKRYGVRHFLDSVASSTVEMCGYLMASDGHNSPVPELSYGSWESGFPDLPVEPDLTTLRPAPADPRAAHLFGRVLTPEGDHLDVDPHTILTRQIDRLAQLGYSIKVGLETEFVLYHGTREQMRRSHYRAPRPVFERNLDYSTDAPPRVQTYLDGLQHALTECGQPVEAIKLEGAPGQVEVTFPYGDALRACRNHIRFQMAAMRLAERSRMTAAFMAAPETGVANGLHVHLSLWQNGQPVLAAGANHKVFDRTLGGLLQTLPELAPLYAPTDNSYRRYQHESFAPTSYNWGADNRGCALRVVGEGDSQHLEIRLAGADANPYLVVAAVIAGILEGHSSDSSAPPASGGSGYDDTAPHVPRTLSQAVRAFRVSRLARAAFGDGVVDHYTHLAQAMHDTQAHLVSDVDRQLWFTRA
ncbi:glutamine synthetase family protein [Streptomyces sp. NBC_00470]|uniref:glutamine synthetase family protein n=1 Tax=Streptomyces sp. NBC_00470 TaxID=2975753 RepID=UPI002F90C775